MAINHSLNQTKGEIGFCQNGAHFVVVCICLILFYRGWGNVLFTRPPVRKGLSCFLSLVTTGHCYATSICVVHCTAAEIKFK